MIRLGKMAFGESFHCIRDGMLAVIADEKCYTDMLRTPEGPHPWQQLIAKNLFFISLVASLGVIHSSDLLHVHPLRELQKQRETFIQATSESKWLGMSRSCGLEINLKLRYLKASG